MLSAATREVATWNFEFSTSANVLLSKCLLELDTVFDVSASPASASIQTGMYGTELAFDADFVLSGAIALPETQQTQQRLDSGGAGDSSPFSRRVVYRVTFRDPAMIPVQNENGAPARFASGTPTEIAEGKLGYVSTPLPGATLRVLPSAPVPCKQPSDGKPRCPVGQCDIGGHCRVPGRAQALECSNRGYWLEL